MKKEAKATGGKRSGGVSISDVARLSGTSLATVSRVLSGSTHPVAEETRQRVREAATALGYQPNAIARALATKRSRTIGLIVGDIADSYFAEIARGVEDAAGPHGYLTIICNADRAPGTELAYFQMLLDHKVAAILFAGGFFVGRPEAEQLRQTVQRAQSEGRLVIALAPRGFGDAPTIAIDNRAVVYDMTRYLIQLGHRRIAFVGGAEGLSTGVERREGFVAAMTEAGLDASMTYNEGFNLEAGHRAALAMLTRSLPDAVLAASDDAAIAVMATFRSAGVDVPGQVSVAGIDDSRMSDIFNLTTVKVAKYELGQMAAGLVVEGKAGAAAPLTIVPHRLVARGSTRFRKSEQAPELEVAETARQRKRK